jgi:hypothetical protein
MKRPMPAQALHFTGLVMALAFPACTWAMDMGDGGKPSAAADPCTAMKAEKMKIQQDRKAAESEITVQIAAMLAAPDKDKVNLMAAIIARMEAQEISIEARKDALEEKMMQAMSSSDKSTAMGCMMMTGDMKGMKDDKGAADMKDMDSKSGNAPAGK